MSAIIPHLKVAMMSMIITMTTNHSRRKDVTKNIEELFPNAAIKVNNTMRTACARIATMLKVERRKHQPVSTKIELCMLKVCARIVTYPFITKLKDQT
jgi:hypothetical protein